MNCSAVVGYHLNPHGCGVARFNAELAQRLGVPFVSLHRPEDWGDFPLISLKWAELDDDDQAIVTERLSRQWAKRFAVFWHDVGHPHIMAAAAIQMSGHDMLWCPSSLSAPAPRPVRLLAYGMAHKLQAEWFRKVRRLLDEAGRPYELRVSVGLHEGTSITDADPALALLADIMGPERVTFLGCLSDAALHEELARADVVTAFFERGVRGNNTTVHAAMGAGVPVLTNATHGTPFWMRHKAEILDIVALDRWPDDAVLKQVGYLGYCVSRKYSWEALVERISGIVQHATTDHRQPAHQ